MLGAHPSPSRALVIDIPDLILLLLTLTGSGTQESLDKTSNANRMYLPENHPPGFKGNGFTGCIPAGVELPQREEKKPAPLKRIRKVSRKNYA